MHDACGHARRRQSLLAGGDARIEWICKVVIPGPILEQIAEDVKMISLQRRALEKLEE